MEFTQNIRSYSCNHAQSLTGEIILNSKKVLTFLICPSGCVLQWIWVFSFLENLLPNNQRSTKSKSVLAETKQIQVKYVILHRKLRSFSKKTKISYTLPFTLRTRSSILHKKSMFSTILMISTTLSLAQHTAVKTIFISLITL